MTQDQIFDCVFLSYDEPLADSLCRRLSSVMQQPVKRLHGVNGARRAYRLTAEVVDSEQYFLADGDFEISTSFSVTTVRSLPKGVGMRVWMTSNPVNSLVYGYGGIKLVRRAAIRGLGDTVDVLASVAGRIEFSSEVAGVTRFNQTPFHAWRAAFRECSRLARGCEYGTSGTRTESWLANWEIPKGDIEFAEWVRHGAKDGIAFARSMSRDATDWHLINDIAWLRHRFTAAYGNEHRS